MALDQSALLEVLDALKVADVGDRVPGRRGGLSGVDRSRAHRDDRRRPPRADRHSDQPAQRSPQPHTSTTAGDLELRIPKLRTGSFFPTACRRARSTTWSKQWAPTPGSPRSRCRGSAPISTRRWARSATAAWPSRPSRTCSSTPPTATYCKARVNHRVVSQAVVIATGVRTDPWYEVLGFAVSDSEDGAFLTAFLRSLKARGMGGVQLVISDAHSDSSRPSLRCCSARRGRDVEFMPHRN
jgi:putative transposase